MPNCKCNFHRLVIHPVVQILFGVFSLMILLTLFSCGRGRQVENYFPETGKAAIQQRLTDLESNLNVLFLSLQPGFEDLAALAFFRIGVGASVMSAYVTNGETSDSDIKAFTPPYIGDLHRREAARAMDYLNSEAYFLNMPDIAAASSKVRVRQLWHSDTLSARLERLILQFKPDIIFVPRDFIFDSSSVRQEIVIEVLKQTVKALHIGRSRSPKDGAPDDEPLWSVREIIVESEDGIGFSLPVGKKSPIWNKSYLQIGQEAAEFYRSMHIQRKFWKGFWNRKYHTIYPNSDSRQFLKNNWKSGPCSKRIASLSNKIRTLVQQFNSLSEEVLLSRLTAVKDSVNYLLAEQNRLRPCEKRALLRWNFGLNNLKTALLGIRVNYSLSDTLITSSQVTVLKIHDVKGELREGKTDIFFAGMDQNWGINEDIKRRLPLKLNFDYRILSPAKIETMYPPGISGFKSNTYGKPIYFFIIHEAKDRKYSFIYRTKLRLFFAPLFVIEIFNPIVRLRPHQKIYFKVMNISRDGVADTLKIHHPNFSSWESVFRLPEKESTYVDSLPLWTESDIPEGSFVVPLRTSLGLDVANIVVRNFDVDVHKTKRIGVVVGVDNSPTLEALRQLTLKPVTVPISKAFSATVDSLNVLILDYRVLSLRPNLMRYKDQMEAFVRDGGHLIVLAQDPGMWNKNPLWEGMHLISTRSMDENDPLYLEKNDDFLNKPNRLTEEDFQGWLFLRASQIISGDILKKVKAPIRSKSKKAPLLITWNRGSGRITYCALALIPQFQNVHAGAFRLMANLVSNKAE